MLMICEVKEIVPARYGFKAVVKHLPDQAFTIDEQLYRRMGRRFGPELAAWAATGSLHMILAATVAVSGSRVPSITELTLMLVTEQWLPVEDAFELELLERLARDGRSFLKGLRFNMPQSQPMVSVFLLDAENSPIPLHIKRPPTRGGLEDAETWPDVGLGTDRTWLWDPLMGVMPTLPVHCDRRLPNRTPNREPSTVSQEASSLGNRTNPSRTGQRKAPHPTSS